MAKFFINRPVLANVLAILMVLLGAVSVFSLPVAQYPNVVPPTVSVTTRYPGATAATWVGGSATGPWRVVPLSVNDCPAEARSQAFGIELQYEKSYRFLVPYGGADFVDVEVPRPDFAERAELMPYGVAFGRSRPDRVALPCTVGWSAQGLRLERLPPGDYQVVWMGGARTEAQDVVVQRAGAPKIGPLVPR